MLTKIIKALIKTSFKKLYLIIFRVKRIVTLYKYRFRRFIVIYYYTVSTDRKTHNIIFPKDKIQHQTGHSL